MVIHRASHIEDEDSDSAVEIDDLNYFGFEKETKITDPFSKVKYSSLSPKMKRRYSRLSKAYVGIDGAESKYIDPEHIDGYSLYDVVNPPYDLDTLASLYDQSAIHNAAINARVMNTVGLGYNFIETSRTRRRIERAQDNPDRLARIRRQIAEERDRLEELFENFNEDETFIESMVKAWLDALSTGNGYIEVGRSNSGEIGYIGHIPSTLVRVRRKRDGFVQMVGSTKVLAVFFRNFQDRETPDPVNGDPNPNEIIHFKIYSPNNSYYGIPSSVAAAAAIVGDKFAKEYNIDYFENKAIPRYAIILKGAKLSNKSKAELINYFRTEVKGRNHGTLVIPIPASIGADSDIKFEKLEAGVQDASFDKYRKSNRDEILVANRVPAPKVGVYDNANLAVSRDADKTFKTQVIGPDQSIIEKKINRLISELTSMLYLKFNSIDLIDDDLQSRIYDRYLRTEVITPNEVRATLQLPERVDGDEVLPYPTKIKKEESTGGAPVGNTNNISAVPRKARVDTPEGASDAMETGTNQERGAEQDNGGRNR